MLYYQGQSPKGNISLFNRDRGYAPEKIAQEYKRKDESIVHVGDIIEYANTNGDFVKGTVEMILPHAGFGEGLAIVNTKNGKEYVKIEAMEIIETKSTPPIKVGEFEEEFEGEITERPEEPQDSSEVELLTEIEDEEKSIPAIEESKTEIANEKPQIQPTVQTLTPEEQKKLAASMKLEDDWDINKDKENNIPEETPPESPVEVEKPHTLSKTPTTLTQRTGSPVSQEEYDALLANMNIPYDEDGEPDNQAKLPETPPTTMAEAPQEIESVLSPSTPEPETQEILPHTEFEDDELTVYQDNGEEISLSEGTLVEYTTKKGSKGNYRIIKINPNLQKVQLQNTERKGFVFAIGENNLIDSLRFKIKEESPLPEEIEAKDELELEPELARDEERIIEEAPVEEITEPEKEPTDFEKLSALIEQQGNLSLIIGGNRINPKIERDEQNNTITLRYGEKEYITFFVENNTIVAKFFARVIEKTKQGLQNITRENFEVLFRAIQGEFNENYAEGLEGEGMVERRSVDPFTKEIQEKNDITLLLQKYDLAEEDKQKLQNYLDFLSSDDIRNPELRSALQINWDGIDSFKKAIQRKLQGTEPEGAPEEEDELNEETEEDREEEAKEKNDDHPIKNILDNWEPGEQILYLSKKKGNKVKTSFAIENAPPCELTETDKGIRFSYGNNFALEITPTGQDLVMEYFVEGESKLRRKITEQKKKGVIDHILFFRKMAEQMYLQKKEIPKEPEAEEEIPLAEDDEYEAGLREIDHRIIDAGLEQYISLDPDQKFTPEYRDNYLTDNFFNTLKQVLNGHTNIPDIFIADKEDAEKMGEDKIKIGEDAQGKTITINPTEPGWPGELSQYLIKNP